MALFLDDYQNCALGFADWSSLDGVQVKKFTDVITTPDALAEQLGAGSRGAHLAVYPGMKRRI